MNRFPLKRELKTAIVSSQKIFKSECFFTNYLKALTEHLHLDCILLLNDDMLLVAHCWGWRSLYSESCKIQQDIKIWIEKYEKLITSEVPSKVVELKLNELKSFYNLKILVYFTW